MPNQNLKPNTIIACLNCNAKINTSDQYCQSCGQKIKSYKLSIWLLIKEVFSSIFNWESKFAKTLLNIWRPVFLAKAYVAGERKKYFNPGRLFIVTFFILSAALSLMLKNQAESEDTVKEKQGLYSTFYKQDMLTVYDSSVIKYNIAEDLYIDSLRNDLFYSKDMMDLDSIDSPPAIASFGTTGSTINLTTNPKYKISTKDISSLSREELLDKYEVKGYLNQLMFIQYLKFKKDRESWSIFMITNALWTIVLSTFVLALFMKLLYIRNKHYYVEHVVFLMTFQSLVFIASIPCIGISFYSQAIATTLFSYVALISSIYFFVCLMLYYRQGFFKTLFKSFLLTVFHLITLLICLLIVGAISFALY